MKQTVNLYIYFQAPWFLLSPIRLFPHPRFLPFLTPSLLRPGAGSSALATSCKWGNGTWTNTKLKDRTRRWCLFTAYGKAEGKICQGEHNVQSQTHPLSYSSFSVLPSHILFLQVRRPARNECLSVDCPTTRPLPYGAGWQHQQQQWVGV